MRFPRFPLFGKALFGVALSSVGALWAQTPTLDSEQWAFLTLINNFRAQNGAGALQVSVTLQNSSQWMSTDMATKNYFSHTDSLGRDPFTRMQSFGYRYYPAGENIAAGNSTAQQAFNQWYNACDPNSSGQCTYAHRVNMANASFKVIGIGRVYNASATYRYYWTTDFGGVVDQVVTPPTGGGGGTTPPPTAPTITSFTATPSTITAGQSSTLAWSVGGATSISISNGVGSVNGLTSKSVSPAATTTYTITATNSSGSRTATATVTVNPAIPTGSRYTIFSDSARPSMAIGVGQAEFGVKFKSDQAGKITGIRFYKYGNGVHTGSLWTTTGQLLATGTFTNETASGWQELTFSTPVNITANTVYIASYHTPDVTYYDGTYFSGRGADNGPLHALQAGVSGGNGVYAYGFGTTFPRYDTQGSNFWVDVVFVK